MRWRFIGSVVGCGVWLSFILSYEAFWAGTYSTFHGIVIMLVALLVLVALLATIWTMPASLDPFRSKALEKKGILLALSGTVVWVLAIVGAANERAVADSCWDPVSGWRCSQTAGSDARFVADVLAGVSYIGIGIAIIGLAIIVVTMFLGKRTNVGST
ncbi:MAG: hypothetical protein E6K11_09535 [Methanobacteriota archaeon]|nr:MAG: hypothetical protein E6K11_09535 [Euryarchaeota archaeon]